MNKLNKIQQLAASVRAALANLKPKADLSNIDEAAAEAAQLREKLNLLERAEQDEQARLDEAQRQSEAKARQAALQAITETANEMTAKHQELTEQAETLIGQLVAVLAERDQVFDVRASGLYDAALNSNERQQLREALERTASPVSIGQFKESWSRAVNQTTSGGTAKRLIELVATLGYTAHTPDPLRPATSRLAEVAHNMAISPRVPEQPAAEPQPEQPTHESYTVDLRPQQEEA